MKRLPQVQVILSGMSTMDQIKDNVATFEDPDGLSDADAETLMQAAETFKKQVNVPCTACRYCCDGCPAQINIPAFLTVLLAAVLALTLAGCGNTQEQAPANTLTPPPIQSAEPAPTQDTPAAPAVHINAVPGQTVGIERGQHRNARL